MAFSADQIEEYLDRIALPQAVRASLREGPNGKDALKAVTALQHQHLATVPFENLDLQYSSQHSLSQETDLVYEHVVKRWRGGVCDQIHLLFTKLLTSFGFSVYCTGSRINAAAGILADPKLDRSKPVYGPWVHLNTIVAIGDRNYIVDTSHGPSGSPYPVPLVHDEPAVDIWPRQRRMIFDSIPGWSNPGQKWWRMQIRSASADPWMDVWCFTETEWLPIDFQLIRAGYSSLGSGWAAPQVCCFQTIFEDKVPVGYLLVLQDELRRNYKGKTEILQKFYSESDRVEALAEKFGLVLTDEEQKQILGHVSEIQGDDFDYYG